MNIHTLILLWAAFPLVYALGVLVWALRQHKGGDDE